jgi:hypothetical protein
VTAAVNAARRPSRLVLDWRHAVIIICILDCIIRIRVSIIWSRVLVSPPFDPAQASEVASAGGVKIKIRRVLDAQGHALQYWRSPAREQKDRANQGERRVEGHLFVSAGRLSGPRRINTRSTRSRRCRPTLAIPIAWSCEDGPALRTPQSGTTQKSWHERRNPGLTC